MNKLIKYSLATTFLLAQLSASTPALATDMEGAAAEVKAKLAKVSTKILKYRVSPDQMTVYTEFKKPVSFSKAVELLSGMEKYDTVEHRIQLTYAPTLKDDITEEVLTQVNDIPAGGVGLHPAGDNKASLVFYKVTPSMLPRMLGHFNDEIKKRKLDDKVFQEGRDLRNGVIAIRYTLTATAKK